MQRATWCAQMVCVGLLVGAGSARAEVDLRGRWEIQTMGADREVEIRQQGNKLIIHRVMWPEFEGERYKLEHLYRGKLAGNAIKGQLWVKEEELPDFEVLRDFVGSVASAEQLIVDGLPLERIRTAPDASPTGTVTPPAPPRVEERPTDVPPVSMLRPSAPPGALNPVCRSAGQLRRPSRVGRRPERRPRRR